jgi:predicted alpha/beta-hydrolase family hydrolase
LTELPLFAGGKSFGGRMTSQAQAVLPLPGVRGLVFIGFPLHPAGRPASARGRHLFDVHVPMLFLQGERDKLSDPQLVATLMAQLGQRATLRLFEHADHSFHVPVRSGRTDEEVRNEVLDTLAGWINTKVLGPVQA